MSAGMVSVPTIIPLKEPGSIMAGSRKWMIDSSTLVELNSTTKNCLLFYTLDGTKPDPFKKIGDKTTHQFLKPFTLKPGKRTVKAIAVLKDGSKESSINTKVFQVDIAEPESDDEDMLKNTSWLKQDVSENETEDIGDNNKLFKKVIRDTTGSKQAKKAKPDDLVKRVLTDSYNGRITPIRNNDADAPFKCYHCHTDRPRDPFARFCNGCGLGLPPAPGGIRTSQFINTSVTCRNCGSRLSSESSFCSVCDKTSKTKTSTERIGCKNCSSMNPITAENCLVCDEVLNIASPECKKNNLVPRPCSDFIQCPFCERINSGDARFCDWCGKKPQTASVTISCERCTTDNSLYAEYCCSCGNVLKTPMRKSFKDNIDGGNIIVQNGDGSVNQARNSTNTPWKKMKLQKVTKRLSKDVSIQAGENLASNILPMKSNTSFNFSPGKGYWRQQVDHICHHLKLYTQNNLEFRESVANYVMSRMVSAIVEESKEDLELILTAKFALQRKDKKTLKGSASALTFINALTANIKARDERRESTGSITKLTSSSRPTSARSRPGTARSRPSSARSRTSSTGSRPGSAKKKKKVQKTFEKIEKEKSAAKLSKLSAENLKVLHMIKSSKIVDEEKLDELLKSENFDPNTKDENDVPMLKLSVVNKRFEFLPLLIEAGADVDKVSGTKESTALHEAVLLGVNGRDAVTVLIDKGASSELKDKKGQSPFDLAVESGIDSLIEKFTKLTSKQLLNDIKL